MTALLSQVRSLASRRRLRPTPRRAERKVDGRAAAVGRGVHLQPEEQGQADPVVSSRAQHQQEASTPDSQEKEHRLAFGLGGFKPVSPLSLSLLSLSLSLSIYLCIILSVSFSRVY